jgi:hypothetical protein
MPLPKVTTTPDHNDAGQWPTKAVKDRADSQVSDSNRRR